MAHNGTSQQGQRKHVPNYCALWTRNSQPVDEMTSLPRFSQLEYNALPTIYSHKLSQEVEVMGRLSYVLFLIGQTGKIKK